MKLGLFIHDMFSRKVRNTLYGVTFHDPTFPDVCSYQGQVYVYDANATLLQELTTTIGQGLAEWSGTFYYLGDPLAENISPLANNVKTPFFLTNLANIRLAYRGPVAVDALGKTFRRTYFDAVWLGVTGPGWFGALRMKRRGWVFRRDHWELYAYAEADADTQLPGPVFRPDGFYGKDGMEEGPDAEFVRITALLKQQ